jgi:hypothetical protein
VVVNGTAKIPNFFIVGAPKCGTTALSEYLREHPNVFMSYPKEPHFFADDLTHLHAVRTFDEYMRLFKGRRPEQTVVGEASAWYLYSENALKRIRDFNRDARIIVMIRNPVDFVQSFHSQLLFAFNEDQEDIVEAWNLQEKRARGNHIPEKCVAPQFLQYRTAAKFGDQMDRLLTLFPRQQVKCIVFDDFISDPKATYLEVLEFLGVPDDGRTEFSRLNVRKVHRSKLLGAFLMRPPPALRSIWKGLKRVFGNELSRLIGRIIEANSAPTSRPPLDPAFRARLAAEFVDDVAKLSRLLGRDLGRWTVPGGPYREAGA